MSNQSEPETGFEPESTPNSLLLTEEDITRLHHVMAGGFSSFQVKGSISPQSEAQITRLVGAIPETLASSPTVINTHPYHYSLITPAEGRQFIRPWFGRFNELYQRVEEVIDTFPASVPGFLGRASIFGGRGPDNQQLKFVGLTFDVDTNHILQGTRGRIIRALGENCLDATFHATVFKTHDWSQAKKLKTALNRARAERLRKDGSISIELMKAKIKPLKNQVWG